MKRKLLALMLSASMVMSLAACGSAEPVEETTTEETEAAAEATTDTDAAVSTPDGAETSSNLTGTLKLGMIGPLTGAAAIYGNSVNNASQIAVEEINAASSDFQIEYNGQDDEHDAEKSVNAYNNLKDWGAQALVGTVTTTPCIAVAAEAYSDRMFMLTPSASSTSVTEGNDNVYQLCFSDPNQGSASAQYIKDNALGEKVAIIYNNSDAYSTGIYQTFVDKAAEVGLEIVSTTTFTDDTANDFSVQVKDAQDNGADLVFLPIYYTPASLIFKAAKDASYEPKFFGVDGMDGILTLEGFDASLAEGVMLLTPFSADATDDLTVSFVSKYESKYSETPSQFAADGYDCVYAVKAALEYYADNNGGLNVDDCTYDQLCDILISVFSDPSFSTDGLTGLGMTWTAEGEVNKAPKAVVIQEGVYVGL